MPAAQRYEFQQRSGGLGAVIRIGSAGGTRLVNVYVDRPAHLLSVPHARLVRPAVHTSRQGTPS